VIDRGLFTKVVMDDNRQKSDTKIREAQVLAKLLKLKSPKLSNAILKDNVREQAILGTKLDLLSQHQKKYQFDLTWKKQLLLKRQRELLVKSNSSPSLSIPPSRCFTLPPIESEKTTLKNNTNLRGASPINKPTLLVKNAKTDAEENLTNEDKGDNKEASSERTATFQGKNLVTKESSYDKSNERALLRWKCAINKARKQVRKPILLSPLLSEKLSKNYDSTTTDPRFARLVEQLVPNIGRGKEKEKGEEESDVDDTSSCDSS